MRGRDLIIVLQWNAAPTQAMDLPVLVSASIGVQRQHNKKQIRATIVCPLYSSVVVHGGLKIKRIQAHNERPESIATDYNDTLVYSTVVVKISKKKLKIVFQHTAQ